MLKDALLRTAQAADIAGIRCLLLHAKDNAARQWYESWEFELSPTDPYHLLLMLKELKNLLSWSQSAPAVRPIAAASPTQDQTAAKNLRLDPLADKIDGYPAKKIDKRSITKLLDVSPNTLYAWLKVRRPGVV